MRHRIQDVRFENNQYVLGQYQYVRGPYAGNPTYTTKLQYNWYPKKYKLDECYDETAMGPPYKWVNPLSITHLYDPGYHHSGSNGTHYEGGTVGSNFEREYSGGYWVSLGIAEPSLLGSASSYANMDLNALGATGWKKFQPAKPVADTGVFLGESRELPRQFRDAVKALKALAFHPLRSVRNMSFLSNQHLAIQFGWLPLLNDLEKFKKALDTGDAWLKRVRKYNGQWEHRGGVVAQGEYVENVGTAFMSPTPTSYSRPPEGISSGSIYATIGYRVWFSAWFKYYVADFDSATTQLRLKARLWGLDRTPTIVWNLLPWSWLVDWFTNLGDNIDNLVPIDGLVAKMPCIMREVWTSYIAQVSQRYKLPSGGYKTVTQHNEKTRVEKARGVASPFGFGFTWDTLTPRQLSILAALGIQRAK